MPPAHPADSQQPFLALSSILFKPGCDRGSAYRRLRSSLYEKLKKFTGRYVAAYGESMGLMGVETPVTPDGPDVLDADYALQGVEIGTWRRVRRVRRVGW